MPRRPPPPAALHESADEVEAQFYDALRSGDVSQMMAVWADDEEVVCVHPGGGRFVGTAAVRASFEEIFAGGSGVNAAPEQVHRLQAGACAVHHLVEALEAEGTRAWVLATNVYIKTAFGWRMVAHHASVAGTEMPAVTGGDAPSTLH